LGDTNVTLPDVDTTNPDVIERYGNWIQAFVKEYNIDGLRIDAAKHVQPDFWPVFCGKAGVFCMGEVFGGAEVAPIAEWQGPLDSVLNFPLYTALRDAFTIPGPRDVAGLVQVFETAKTGFKDMTVLGNFLENHDVPRWHNLSVDPQSLYNAMTWNFMTEGIPLVYAGQEQAFSGPGDPYNREALWPSKYDNSSAYQLIATLNRLRNFLVSKTDWLTHETQILTSGEHGVGMSKGMVVTVLTNIGSPPAMGIHIAVKTPYPSSTAMTNIFTCKQWVVGASGSIDVEYSLGGVPVVLVPSSQLTGSGLCGADLTRIAQAGGRVSGAASSVRPPGWLGALFFAAASSCLALGL
jgi:alpha-amylase